MTWNTKLDADQTCEFLTSKLRANEPFCFIRFGDADIDWMGGGTGHTCDQEHPRDGLKDELLRAWDTLLRSPHFYLGDLESFDSPAEASVVALYRKFREGYAVNDLHTEALLLHRVSDALIDFYRALIGDSRKKLLVAPSRVSFGGRLLGAAHVTVDSTRATSYLEKTIDAIEGADWEILITCCGRASKILAAHFTAKYPERTIIELGSALDPLFVGQTRGGQLPMKQAREMFEAIL